MNGDEDYIHINKVVAKLKQANLVTGIWVYDLDPSNAMGIVRGNNFPTQEQAMDWPMIDFAFIELEHQPYDITKLRHFVNATISRREVLVKGNLQPNMSLIVRLPVEGIDSVRVHAKQVLDLGVHGIAVPHVRNADEALQVIRACRFAQPADSPIREPAGVRGASPGMAFFAWGMSREQYVKRADVWPLNPSGDIFVILMIEDTEGVENLDSILKVPGIGAIAFGPYDYSFSCGRFGDEAAPEVAAARSRVKAACDSAGVPFIGFADAGNIEQRVRENHRMLFIGMDIDPTGGHQRVLDYLRAKKGKSA